MRKGTQVSGTSASPTGESSAAARSGISRRRFLVTAGALGVAAAALPILGAETAKAFRSDGGPIFLGSNQDIFAEIKTARDADGNPIVMALPVGGLNGVRTYGAKPKDQESIIPATTWPAGPPLIETKMTTAGPITITIPYAGPIVHSIYPDPRDVLDHGVSYYAINSLVHNAPKGSYLAAWHEGLSEPHPDYITAQSLYDLHGLLNRMCQGTNVTYGAIFGGSGDTWDSVPDNLGFYGKDVYANFGIETGTRQLDDWIQAAKDYYGSMSDSSSLQPGTVAHYPNLLIAETNMPPDSTTGSTAQRGAWFEAVCNRMKTYGTNAIGVLTFWNPTGSLGGPWLPEDQQTEEAMNYIIANIF